MWVRSGSVVKRKCKWVRSGWVVGLCWAKGVRGSVGWLNKEERKGARVAVWCRSDERRGEKNEKAMVCD